jgi:hypothetical protein
MDIVKRLQKLVGVYIGDADIDDELLDAKYEIERLRKENDRQRYDIMLLNSRLQTEHEIIRIAALKEGE